MAIRKWLATAKSLCSKQDAKDFSLDSLQDEINMLEKELPRECQEIGFCHNDLQYGNIMMDEETRAITIIVCLRSHYAILLKLTFQRPNRVSVTYRCFQDYEYASYNPVAYDIANHFCEMVADYHSETPHVLDYSKYPGNRFWYFNFFLIN